jgi:hypothetical protein
MDACSFGFGCRLVAAWFPFGFRLVLVWFGFGLARVCVFVSGWFLVVRSSGPVLDGVDDVICLVCLVYLDSLVTWFCLGLFRGETCLSIWGTYAVHRFSLHAAIHLQLLNLTISST